MEYVSVQGLPLGQGDNETPHSVHQPEAQASDSGHLAEPQSVKTWASLHAKNFLTDQEIVAHPPNGSDSSTKWN